MTRMLRHRHPRVRSAVRLVVSACILGLTALTGLAALASGQELEKELVIVASGGVFEQLLKEHFYEPFTRATGVQVISVAAHGSEQWAKVKAMVQNSNVEWDIITTSDASADPNRDLLAKLDCAAIPAARAQGVEGTCRENRLLRTIGGGAIAYNTKVFPTGRHPRSWADFWDVKRFPGPRALMNAGSPWWVLAAALMADGVMPQDLTPMDLDRAFRKMDQIRPHVRVWWKTGDQSQQIMRDGEVVLNMMWSGRAQSLKAVGVPVDVEWNQAIQDLAYWSIVKDAPHPKAAQAFLNFFMGRPEAHLAFSAKMHYDTSNRLAVELLPQSDRPGRVTYGANWSQLVDLDARPWIAANRAAILERWNAWLAQ